MTPDTISPACFLEKTGGRFREVMLNYTPILLSGGVFLT